MADPVPEPIPPKVGDDVLYTLDRGAHLETLPAKVTRAHADGAADLVVFGLGRYLEAVHVKRSTGKPLVGTWQPNP